VYEDAQDGYDYKKGDIVSWLLSNRKRKNLNIQLHKEGKYDTNYTKYKINLMDFLLGEKHRNW
jgi:alpha-glucosidase